jgi:hypothetical protein
MEIKMKKMVITLLLLSWGNLFGNDSVKCLEGKASPSRYSEFFEHLKKIEEMLKAREREISAKIELADKARHEKNEKDLILEKEKKRAAFNTAIDQEIKMMKDEMKSTEKDRILNEKRMEEKAKNRKISNAKFEKLMEERITKKIEEIKARQKALELMNSKEGVDAPGDSN